MVQIIIDIIFGGSIVILFFQHSSLASKIKTDIQPIIDKVKNIKL